MKKYKAIIMDFDMTIANTAGLIEECLYNYALRFGYDMDRKILRRGIGMSAGDIFRSAGVHDDKLADEMDDGYVIYSADIMCRETEIFPGVARGMKELYERGVLLAVLSLKSGDQIWPPLRNHGLDGYVRQVVGKDDVARGKPCPDGIYLLADQMGIATDDILYVGDSLTDQQTALAAGVDFGAICSGAFCPEDFSASKAIGIYSDFGEMSRELCQALDQ